MPPESERCPSKWGKDDQRGTANMMTAQSVAQAVAGAKTDEEKISALTVYIRAHLRSVLDPDVTEAERKDFIKKLPDNRARTSSEILKSGMATPAEMNVAFGSLAALAGFDARPAFVANR